MLRGLIRGALARPCTVVVAALLIVVLGGLCITDIPVDILPVNSSPAVQVLTFYGGMPAATVEKNITSRLERQTGQASGRTRQESRSIIGASIVRNYFGGDVDPNNALAQVNSLATAAAKNLPPGTDPPVILPFDPTATTPVCIVALDSESESESALYDVGRYEVRNMIMGLPGANAPAVHGGKLRAILAYLDRHKLEARQLSPVDVMEALDDYNLFLPTGDAKLGAIDYAVDSNAMYQVVDDMGDIPLREEPGNAAYLRDVATPVDGNLMQSSLVRVNGKRQVYIPVYRQQGASTLAVVDTLKSSLESMMQRLSRGGIDLKLVMDQSIYVRHSIKALVEEGVLGALMCSLVILLFLGNGRMTAIALLTIPLSVLAAIVGLHATGNTINVMTLAGLSLAIGPLVDLAVICLENTHRHLVLGRSPGEAALEGTGEVATPALVATCCILIVLAPLAFLPELGEFLFRPMAVAVAFAMGAAYLLSQTLVPLCCSAWLKPHVQHDNHSPERLSRRVWSGWTGQLDCLNDRYARALDRVLRFRLATAGFAVVMLFGSVVVLGPRLQQEFFPEVDAGSFEMTVRAPSGTRLEITEQRVADVESAIRESVASDLQLIVAEVGVVADWSAAYTPNSGPMDAAIKVQLRERRARSAQEHVRRLRTMLAADERFGDLEFGFDTGGLIRTAMNGGKSTPINIRLSGRDLHQLRDVAKRLKERIATVEGIVDARILQRLDYPQYVIDIDRTKAADLGLALPYVMKNVVAALNSSIQFNKKNFYIDPLTRNQYYVGVQYPEHDIESIETLLDIPITSPTQRRTVPLRNLVTLRQSTCPTEVVRNDLQSCVELVMAVDGRDLGHTAAEVAGVLDRFGKRLPDGGWQPFDPSPDAEGDELLRGARIELSGEYAKMQQMFRNLGGGCLLATLLVYFVLVTLFQSFRVPLVILAAVPIGATGVILMLYVTDTAVNVQSLLGLVFMVGIVVANTVLMIDLAGTLRRDEGLPATEAIRRAATVRMRPVLMTALAALLALVPMALALAPGSEANAPLGRAVIGGLLAGLVTTLFVVPCLYSLVERDRACAA